MCSASEKQIKLNVSCVDLPEKKKTLLSTLPCVMIAFVLTKIIIKLLLTGPKGNKEFCFPEIPPQGEALRGTLRVKGNQKSLFPKGAVIKCFVIPPDSKIEELQKNYLLDLIPMVVVPTV